MSSGSQFRVCEQILLPVSLIYRYILQDSWNYPSLTKTQCIFMTHIVYMYYAVHIRRKCFVKILHTVYMAPNSPISPDLNPAICPGLCSRACIVLQFPGLDDLKDRARTCWENLDQQIINKSGVTNWRLWFDWMMDTLNSCFDYLVHLLPCCVTYRTCSKNICAFCHCVSSIMMVLWQKVNIANN